MGEPGPPRPLPRQFLPASPIPHSQHGVGLLVPREPLSPAPRCYPGVSLQLCFPGVAHLLRVGCIDWMP